MDCIFCKIVKGEAPCFKVYEDTDFICFLSTNPNSKGHTLIVPKTHYKDIFDMPEELLSKILPLAKRLTEAISKYTGIQDFNIVQNNGIVSGQAVFHYHLHVIPRDGQQKVCLGEGKSIEERNDLLSLEVAEEIKKLLN